MTSFWLRLLEVAGACGAYLAVLICMGKLMKLRGSSPEAADLASIQSRERVRYALTTTPVGDYGRGPASTSPARTVPPSVLRGSSSAQENERVFRDPCSTSCPELSMTGAPRLPSSSRRAGPARKYDRLGTVR